MKKILHSIVVLSLSILIISCNQGKEGGEAAADENTPNLVKKRRDDGTLSSINPVDDDGYVHGVKVNFYEDGVTVHSKITYEHGRKHGPAIWFFKSGKIYEHTEYYQNRRNGVTKRYYETGELYEETTYEAGEELPGKKRYDKAGKVISTD
jgi:antitoxin component YwqK of YwqJK toxin-antitoxin module